MRGIIMFVSLDHSGWRKGTALIAIVDFDKAQKFVGEGKDLGGGVSEFLL